MRIHILASHSPSHISHSSIRLFTHNCNRYEKQITKSEISVDAEMKTGAREIPIFHYPRRGSCVIKFKARFKLNLRGFHIVCILSWNSNGIRSLSVSLSVCVLVWPSIDFRVMFLFMSQLQLENFSWCSFFFAVSVAAAATRCYLFSIYIVIAAKREDEGERKKITNTHLDA